MDEFTAEKLDDVRRFVENEDGNYPHLSDLPAWWDAIGPDGPAKDGNGNAFDGVTQRQVMLLRYLVYARTKRWAWDGLDRLHKVLMERGDKIPEPLQKHINEAYHGLLKRPVNPRRNPRFAPKDERDFRIMRVIADLRRSRTKEQAIADAADAIGERYDTVNSVVKKMEHFWTAAVERGTKPCLSG